jgi:hypothetical protein
MKLITKEEVQEFCEFVERGFVGISGEVLKNAEFISRTQKIIFDYNIVGQVDAQLLWLDIKSSAFADSLRMIASL